MSQSGGRKGASKLFSKILIANRGEIACRVIRTCRRLGIKTVAVYSDADADALHVREADEAVRIGPAPAAQSYLSIDAILAACRETGAEAVHPGYGFLSERAQFAEALDNAGITFIGPGAKAIAAMGDKIESKKLAEKAGVSTVPGHLQSLKGADEAVEVARRVGYPVMLKASAGGGGKGMRIARNDREVREGFLSAANEARSAFGDDRVFIERYIEEPRHIEIQILADHHGTVLYLGERECSVQRRHQKVLEEAPSPFIDAKTRAAMGAEAVALAKAVGYRSAGTVEFIVDTESTYYFLEMNTRLQVEHPVTELVTGLDLVEQMIRIAAGEKLALAQKDVSIRGWAVEARVYAEDPRRSFLPSTGRLTRYRPPPEDGHIRVDTGVYEGAEISIYYDPMIAKLIGYGGDRAEAIRHARAGLDRFIIGGVRHNVDFLSTLLGLKRFGAGQLSTNLIAAEFPQGFHGAALGRDDTILLASLAAALHQRATERDACISGQLPGRRRGLDGNWVVRLGRDMHPVSVKAANGGTDVEVGGRTMTLRGDLTPGGHLFDGTVNGHPLAVKVERAGIGYRLAHGGVEVDALVLTPSAATYAETMPVKAPPDLSRYLISPMPGLLVSLAVATGQEVKAGETLAVIEAMKMENVLKAERDGTIKELLAKPGDSLAVDQKILEFA
ncbi:MAG: acetyl/propionyl/methylcrotonyl-CoA carboxylase subunit alpha [Proteobacteria bacterium]|nr:acetyl/propionyl/methylcrotonyl-CoA carboxylase subunit alpha [Pseudomonadota bacterium]MBI3496729.1 acetyl/propionyl/methylcrotonyl-CoA carboxylase subunit alpha [Pseudomonadota bacterium]